MLELYGRKNAYNVQKVLWTLAELGLEYQHHDVGSTGGELETPEFLALNPHTRIPVLIDNGNSFWESNSIIRYLAATYSEKALWIANRIEIEFNALGVGSPDTPKSRRRFSAAQYSA